MQLNRWNFRSEVIFASHRWYWILFAFFLGAVIGWLVSFIWPAPYRSTLDLYVGLNAYRSTRDLYVWQVADEELRSLDDYKNWQMGQLNSLVLSDEFLLETLIQLQKKDSYWNNLDVSQLRTMLSVAWRNTGDWHFGARVEKPTQAEQAVMVWTAVSQEKISQAIAAAREMIFIDSDLQAVSQALVEAELRQQNLLQTQEALAVSKLALEASSPDQPLAPMDHWHLLAVVTRSANWNAGWQNAINQAPDLGALPASYLAWLTQVNALIDAELTGLPDQITLLQEQHAELTVAYHQAASDSRALSANLEVNQIQDEAPNTVHLRPAANLMLVGGILGVLCLSLGWFVQITRRTE